jgi:hypothetical protein
MPSATRDEPAPDEGAVLLHPPTDEMRRVDRALARLLGLGDPRAGALRRLVAAGMVASTAHFANLSLEFQAYLFDVFHRRRPARLVHALLQPLTVVALLAGLAALRLPAGPPRPGLRALEPNGAWLAGLALAVWYVVQALENRMALLAAVMAGFALGGAAAATLLRSLAAAPGAPGLFTTSPWSWVLGLSLLVTLSHLSEPAIPPRLNGCARWTTWSELFRRPAGQPSRAGRTSLRLAVLGLAWGTLNELWASWRLTPLSVLAGLFALGYQPARRARLRAWVATAIQSGNPALDFIGVGGATPLAEAVRRAPPAPPSARLDDLDLDEAPWRLERARGGVAVYSSAGLGCPFVGFKTVTEHEASVGELARYLGEGLLQAMAEMNDRYAGGEVLRELGAGPNHRASVVRTAFRMPKGMAGREFVHLLYERRRGPDEVVLAYLSVDDEGLPPPARGFVRCPTYPSGQRIRAVASGRTRVEHLMVYDLAGLVPAWAQNTLFRAGHVAAYEREWRALVLRFARPRGAGRSP